MSNVHFISLDGTEFTAIFHVPVPAGNNNPGVPWSTIVLRQLVGSAAVTVMPDGDGTLGTIAAAEKSQLVAGTLYEIQMVNHWSAAFPSGAQIDAIFTQVSNRFANDLQTKYARYGAVR